MCVWGGGWEGGCARVYNIFDVNIVYVHMSTPLHNLLIYLCSHLSLYPYCLFFKLSFAFYAFDHCVCLFIYVRIYLSIYLTSYVYMSSLTKFSKCAYKWMDRWTDRGRERERQTCVCTHISISYYIFICSISKDLFYIAYVLYSIVLYHPSF